MRRTEAAGRRRLMIGALALALAVVIARPSASGQDEVRPRLEALGMQTPVVLDEDGEVAGAYQVTGTPTVYLLDRRAQIIGRAIGRRDWASEEGRRLIAAVLSSPTGRRP